MACYWIHVRPSTATVVDGKDVKVIKDKRKKTKDVVKTRKTYAKWSVGALP